MYLMYRYARDQAGVTVVLSGEGADEVFGGYSWYRSVSRRATLRKHPILVRLMNMYGGVHRKRVIARVMDGNYPFVANAVTAPEILAQLGVGVDGALAERRLRYSDKLDERDALFLYDQQCYLPAILRRQDRMAMAAGVEARVVFLDRALVEFANSQPWQLKLAGGQTKALLRQIAPKWLPRQTLSKSKVGFTLPLREWLGPKGSLGERVADLRRSSSFLNEVFPKCDWTSSPECALSSMTPDISWSLIALDSWRRMIVDPSVGQPSVSGALRASWSEPGDGQRLSV